MITSSAINHLESLGYRRQPGEIEISVADEGLPVFIALHGKTVFLISHELQGEKLVISGKWINSIKKINFFRRFFRLIRKLFSTKRNSG